MTRTSHQGGCPARGGRTGDCTGDASTSPRGEKVANDDGYDLGQGEAFILMPRNRRGRRITGCMISAR